MTQISPQLVAEAKRYLSPSQDALVNDVVVVLASLKHNHINDYSFLVSPISKAYEGYLKDFFLKTHVIDKYDYESDRFRVGKTLNPSLRYKRFSIYQKLANLSEEGESLAEKLWSAWKYGRNEIFHYFPNNLKNLTREEAEERIAMLLNAIIVSANFYKKYLDGTLL
ncbi:MAG: hypothetical protein US68_C0005G0045 [Candidatus Shapirobacteria bacterium GW2011_GWE1_38_10]|uniref:Bacterial toxin RNase RnlA/LsoA DBD domain-containing protein n=1 Tax=Candidatus Shapirobacteria bacterium GW2011_GWE1_38_10 TaxID=1618488 RepID=A0A0G0I557_9BACT|nr:MAG: hypothetical protein US46_C0001G0038 [Candidatus Shapirobacteria bacterium GW2011_GWF2_37_20]KKQ50478.1 MAG: hypothetical protein US68_C0005G0045 [Candidatus Shapirobacteria bacterium GW2011_GWE1_38_10]KKQ65135.1 MAG: hypothetical protein US85_C0001G0062 [Candidatus Shapirobacteria bacterium GW2011_GWF1_38_23]HBP50926.1 hypothetical protein [Candidatus Shapirobacteria bacterium]